MLIRTLRQAICTTPYIFWRCTRSQRRERLPGFGAVIGSSALRRSRLGRVARSASRHRLSSAEAEFSPRRAPARRTSGKSCGASRGPSRRPDSLCSFALCCNNADPCAAPHARVCPAAVHAILERAELLDADRPARVHAPGGDADLGAEAELAAVGELGRGVVQHDRGIDLFQEALRGRGVLGDDAVGVMRAIASRYARSRRPARRRRGRR